MEFNFSSPPPKNEAKYEAILMGLRIRKALGAKNLPLQSDSKLVVRQIKEEYKAKEDRTQKYLRLINHLAQEFDRVEFVQVPRSQYIKAGVVRSGVDDHRLEDGSPKVSQH